MGSTPNRRQPNVYGSLLRLYPTAFQKHYSVTMQQTFDDMLEGEQSKLGRGLIWARTLVDLPVSVTKEHLTDGKDLIMNRASKFILAGAIIAIIIIGLAAFWKGIIYSRNTIGIARVTTAQLADAMQHDDFYSTYGNAVVLFSGKISAIKLQGNTTQIILSTGRPYSVACQFPNTVSFKPHEMVSLIAPAGSAERQPHGVLLHNCQMN